MAIHSFNCGFWLNSEHLAEKWKVEEDAEEEDMTIAIPLKSLAEVILYLNNLFT